MNVAKFQLGFSLDFYLFHDKTVNFNMHNNIEISLNISSGKVCEGSVVYELKVTPGEDIDLVYAISIGKKIIIDYLKFLDIITDIDIVTSPNYIAFDDQPILLNKDEIDTFLGFKSRVSAAVSRSATYSVKVRASDSNYLPAMETDAPNLYNKLVFMESNDRKSFEIIEKFLKWNHRASQSDNIEDRFIFRWIAFDVLTSIKQKNVSNSIKGIKEFVNFMMDSAIARKLNVQNDQLYDDIISKNYTSFGGRRTGNAGDRSQKLYEGRTASPINHKSVVMYALLCIYEYRNQLFHLGDLDSDQAKRYDKYIKEILALVMDNVLS